MPLRLFHQQKHHKVQTREVNWIYRRNTQKIALHKRLSMLYTGKNLWILTRKQILNYLRNLIKFVSRIISFGETIHKYMRHVKLHSMSKYFFSQDKDTHPSPPAIPIPTTTSRNLLRFCFTTLFGTTHYFSHP